MKSKGKLPLLFIALANTALAANAPIQRVDAVNMLGISNGSATSVVVSFYNGVSTPCYTKTLAYLGAITVLSGVGQACVSPITSVNVTPVAGSFGATYETPVTPTSISNTQYSTQITISQNTPPVYDPSNGSLLLSGTLQVTTVTNWAE
ncbi:MAG: hypothetical protein QM652_12980 [Legionella sp.]|uniref:hypothetical protein n=1 Tax=Legionella sp. TaxID=459 RepID=UPI0039E43011